MALAPALIPDLLAEAPSTVDETARRGVPKSSIGFIPELESVRGIAVLLVFAFHIDAYVRYPFSIALTATLPQAFVRAGYTGVDLFFVLSGFLLSIPFLTDVAGGRRASVGYYFVRRALRILPLYYVAVLAGAALTAAHPGDLVRGLPYLLFLNAIPGMSAGLLPYSAVWWSLATEFQFYLLLPLLLILRWRIGRWAGVAFLGAYAWAYAGVVRGTLHAPSTAWQQALLLSVFARGPLFLSGILAAAVYLRFGERIRGALLRRRWLRLGGADVAMLALVVVNALFLQWLVSIGPMRQMGSADQPWHIANGAIWAAFILLLLLAPLRTKALFVNRVLGWLGLLSYSIYLIHAPLFQQSLTAIRTAWPHRFHGWTLRTTAVVAALTVVCLVLSTLTYRFIERPFLVRKQRFAS